jgi:hypothetical protein
MFLYKFRYFRKAKVYFQQKKINIKLIFNNPFSFVRNNYFCTRKNNIEITLVLNNNSTNKQINNPTIQHDCLYR